MFVNIYIFWNRNEWLNTSRQRQKQEGTDLRQVGWGLAKKISDHLQCLKPDSSSPHMDMGLYRIKMKMGNTGISKMMGLWTKIDF